MFLINYKIDKSYSILELISSKYSQRLLDNYLDVFIEIPILTNTNWTTISLVDYFNKVFKR